MKGRRQLARKKQMKAICCICNKGIWNRMVYTTENTKAGQCWYAHTSCSRKQKGTEWEPAW